MLGTEQADVLAADKGLRKQATVPTSEQYSPAVLEQSCLENFMTQFTLFSWALDWLSYIGSQRSQFKALATHAVKLPVPPQSSSSSGPLHTTDTNSIS